MENKKGMTLIEVILALFLLGLMTVVFLPATWASYKMMGTAKNMTVDLFLTQQEIEQEMEKARDQIYAYKEDNTKPNPMTRTIRAFGKDVQGISIKKSITNSDGRSNLGDIYTFIADKPVLDEGLPELQWVRLETSDSSHKLGPIHWDGNNLTGSSKIKDRANYFMSLKKWYISKPGFDGHIPDIVDNESHWGTRYPSWPNDYELISNDRDQLTSLKDYLGRHVVYSVIPVSKTSQYGVEQPSRPVYVMGLPILSNLLLHLDTYPLALTDGSKVTQWIDLRGNKKAIINNGDGVELQYDNGKFLQFRGDSLVTENMGINSDQLTIFVVFNNMSHSQDKSQNIISRKSTDSGWQLQMANGAIEFLLYTETNPTDPLQLPVPFEHKLTSANVADQSKHIVTAKISAGDIKMIIDKEDGHENIPVSHTDDARGNSTPYITIGDSQSEENIYEIIIYNSALSDEDTDVIRRYLSQKHRVKINE